jgi:hypothetical protein
MPKRKKLSNVQEMRGTSPLNPQPRANFDLERDSHRRHRERKIGTGASCRPNPNVPIGWPSDFATPAWAEH